MVTHTRLVATEVVRSDYILKAKLTALPDGLDIWCGSTIKNNFKGLDLGNQRDGLAIN